jgi:hypothetical protein
MYCSALFSSILLSSPWPKSYEWQPSQAAQITSEVILFADHSRGSFGPQAVHELYPKLLKRLDDSSDSVRATVCATLETFLMCAPGQHFRYYTVMYSGLRLT